MLAINNNNQVVEIEEKQTAATLVLVDNKPQPEGLLKMKALLNDKRFQTSHIYDSVLNSKERQLLCFAAGLNKSDLSKAFKEFSDEQKLALHKAVLMMQRIFRAFNEAKAISPAKFLQTAEQRPTIKGVL